MSTDVNEFLGDLDGGVFVQKISTALSNVAAGVINHGKPGKVKIEFDLARIPKTQQVHIAHKLTYVEPTERGKLSEDNTTETPMYVGRGGKLTIFPEDQNDFIGKPWKEGQQA